MSKVKHYNTRLSHDKLDFLSDVLGDFCEQQELPFMSADDLLYGQIVTTTKQKLWLHSYMQLWQSLDI